MRADRIQAGMHVLAPSWWGASAGSWLRVMAVQHPAYHGQVAIHTEGGRWMVVRPDLDIRVREEGSRGGDRHEGGGPQDQRPPQQAGLLADPST